MWQPFGYLHAKIEIILAAVNQLEIISFVLNHLTVLVD